MVDFARFLVVSFLSGAFGYGRTCSGETTCCSPLVEGCGSSSSAVEGATLFTGSFCCAPFVSCSGASVCRCGLSVGAADRNASSGKMSLLKG